jgi:hypothetical protein
VSERLLFLKEKKTFGPAGLLAVIDHLPRLISITKYRQGRAIAEAMSD